MSVTSVREGGPILKGPWDFDDSPISRVAEQPLLLGLFLNLQDIKTSTHPTTNSWTFDYNLALVQKAEELGFELAFSRSQWLPKGGYDGEASIDAFVALGAMAAATKRIMLISTLHVLYGPLHPLHIAKWGATLDHISKGRWELTLSLGIVPLRLRCLVDNRSSTINAMRWRASCLMLLIVSGVRLRT